MSTPKSRIFSDIYDSVRQRVYAPGWSEDDPARDGYVARLRLDAYLWRTVVVTDAQLLDGTVFLGMGPERLAAKLPLRHLEVRARSESLAAALKGFVVSPDRSTLSPLRFSAIPGSEARGAVQAALSERPSSDVRSWLDVPRILQESGVEQGQVEALREAWGAWVAAQESESIRVQRWDNGRFDLKGAMRAEPLESLRDQLLSTAGIETVDEILAHSGYRSDLMATIAASRSHAEREELLDLLKVESWFHRAYNRAAAWQHECLFEATDHMESAHGPRFGRLMDRLQFGPWPKDISPDLEVPLPSGFMDALAYLPLDDYEFVMATNREDLESWWTQGDLDALKRAVNALVERVLSARPSRGLPRWAQAGLKVCAGGVGGAVGAAVAGLPGAVLGGAAGAAMGEGVEFVLKEAGDEGGHGRLVRRIVEHARCVEGDNG